MLASSGNEIKLWDLESNDLINEFPSAYGPIHTFNIRSDNAQIASVVNTNSIKLINLDSDGQFEIKETSDPKCCCYDSSGRHLVVGTSNSFLEFYEFKSQSMKKNSWKTPTSGLINCMSWGKNDRFIASGNSNGAIFLFNTVLHSFSKPLVQQNRLGLTTGVTTLQYSFRNTAHLASGYDDGTVALWDTIKESIVNCVKAHISPCTSVVLSPFKNLLMVSSGLDAMVNFYDYDSNKLVKTMSCTGGITSLDLYSNNCYMAVGTVDGFVYTYDIRGNTDVPLTTIKAHDTAVHCIKYFQNLQPQALTALKSKASMVNTTSNSLYNGQTIQQFESTPLNMKKSNSFTFDLNSQTSSLNPSLGQPVPMSIYSPENHRSIYKINSIETNDSFGLNNKPLKPGPLSSTSNGNNFTSPNGYGKATNFSKISKRGDLYSPSPRGDVVMADENSIMTSPCSNFTSLTTLAQKPSIKVNSPLSQPICNCKSVTTTSSATQTDQELMPVQLVSSSRSEQNGAIFDMIGEIIKGTIEDFRDELMNENFKFKCEMLKEFLSLKRELQNQKCVLKEAFIEDYERIKEENKRLKKMF